MKARIIMKKTIAVVAALLGAAGCGQRGEAKVLRIATQPAPLFAPLLVAKQKGWIEEALKAKGVAVKWTSFQAGPPMNESFAAGEQDLGVMGDSPALIARASGQDTRVVGMSASGPRMLAILVPAASPIRQPSELKGKRVAVVKGSYAHHLLALVLQGAKLGFGDVELVNLGHADIGAALQAGQVDAGAVWEPQLTRLEAEGTARVLQDGTGIKKGALVIVAAQRYASKNAEVVQEVLRVYQRAADFIREHPGEAAEVLGREVKLDPKLLATIFAKADFDPGLHPDDVAELTASEAFMRSGGITRTAVDIDGFVDARYARAAGLR